MDDTSPTARALLVLEMIQNRPGITAERLAERLGVSERATRRYVAILREADVPVESVRGRYGGYRLGRGLRVPPLMFTPTEALGLVMAVLEAHRGRTDGDDPVDTALDKIIRVLPAPVAGPAAAVRGLGASGRPGNAVTPDPATTGLLAQAGSAQRRVRIGYLRGPDREVAMDVDPWAVVVRRGRWFLLCWSHTRDARRVLRIDRVTTVALLPETFTPPPDLDPMRMLEEQLAEGWRYAVEVVVDAPLDRVERWISRSLGRLEAIDAERTRVVGSTEAVEWYAAQLVALRAPFHVLSPAELRTAVADLGRTLLTAAGAEHT